ncbi:hypothetical protein AB0F90_09020 [Micromonospora chalcea]|uniref:hypothetical protein n=1 Tax=Micromonospora chalcea TaxID=1874 RepID=UPI0033EAAF13
MIPADTSLSMERVRVGVRFASEFAVSRRTVVKVGGEVGSLWPLFNDERPVPIAPFEIDTCATSLGLLSSLMGPALGNAERAEMIEQALVTLISLRRVDGSWPSIRLTPSISAKDHMEGIVNDTIFAVQALLSAGFLAPDGDPGVPPTPASAAELSSAAARAAWLQESVDWIERNRVGMGWYYTDTTHMASPDQYGPAVGPTASMVVLLDEWMSLIRPEHGVSYHLRLRAMRDDAISWLKSAQAGSGGFGRSYGGPPLLGHTALAVLALLRGADSSRDELGLAARWLVRRTSKRKVRKLVVADCFDEYEQLLSRGRSRYVKRIISHEYPIEALLVRAMGALLLDFRFRSAALTQGLQQRVAGMGEMLLDRQAEDGTLKGSFRSRRVTAGEHAPVYWVYQGVLALRVLQELCAEGFLREGQAVRSAVIVAIMSVALFVIYLWANEWSVSVMPTLALIASGILVNLLTYFLTRNR